MLFMSSVFCVVWVVIYFVLKLMLLHMLHCVTVAQVGLFEKCKMLQNLALPSLGHCWNYLFDILTSILNLFEGQKGFS